MMEVSRVETWALPDKNHIKFGSAMEGFLPVEKGEKAEVKTFVNEEDEDALIKSIRDARRRSDVVIIASLHSHEGVNENWYAPVQPTFVEEYAHKAVAIIKVMDTEKVQNEHEQNDVIRTEKMIQKRCDRQMPYVLKIFWKTVVVAVASL